MVQLTKPKHRGPEAFGQLSLPRGDGDHRVEDSPASAISSSRTWFHLSARRDCPTPRGARKRLTIRVRSSASGGSRRAASRGSARAGASGRRAAREAGGFEPGAAPRSSSSGSPSLRIVRLSASDMPSGRAPSAGSGDAAGLAGSSAGEAKDRAKHGGSSCGRWRRRDAKDRRGGSSSRLPGL